MNTAENEPSLPAPTARRAASTTSSAVPVAAGSVAPVGRRVAAFALDTLVALVALGIGYVVVAAAGSSASAFVRAVPLVLVLGVGIGQWVAEARSGATVGNALLGTRTLSVQTGRPAGLLAILLRTLVIGLGSLACGLGQWVVVGSGAWDRTPAQRGWHDKAAGTMVLRAGTGRQPAGRTPAAPAPRTAPTPRPVEPAVAAGDAREPVGLIPLVPVFSTAAPTPAPQAPPIVAAEDVPEHESAPALVPLAPVGEPDRRPAEHAPTFVPPPPGGEPNRDAVAQPPSLVALPPVVLGEPEAGAVALPPVAQTPPLVPLVPVFEQPLVGTPAPARTRRDRTAAADGPILRGAADPHLSELEHTRLREPAPERAPAHGLRLRFDTGEQVDVTGDGLVGRNPGPEPSADHVVAIDDPERSISKVHLAFGLEAGGRLWVMDRGSTNGTVVVAPDGRSAVLVAGARATVAPGSTVRFGRRSVQVTER